MYWRIVDWLYKRWDVTNDEFTLVVYGVCEGGAMVWETWLALAPLETLRRGLALIEQEDSYLGPESPWRQPKYPLESYGERAKDALEHAIAEGSERHPLLGESRPPLPEGYTEGLL